jgi:hypothetical protein
MELPAIDIAVVDIAGEYFSRNRELDRQDFLDLKESYFHLRHSVQPANRLWSEQMALYGQKIRFYLAVDGRQLEAPIVFPRQLKNNFDGPLQVRASTRVSSSTNDRGKASPQRFAKD